MAELECGHAQHVRHTPPWQVRPWVVTPEGRAGRLGTPIPCGQCDAGQTPADPEPRRIAERVRSALVQTALAAYADAGLRGLCHEGAWEAAVSAMRQVELDPVATARASAAESPPSS